MGSLPSLMPRLRRGSARGSDRPPRPGGRGRASTPTACASACASNDPALLERLAPHLPPGWRPCASPEVDQIFSVWVSPRGARARTVGRVYAGGQRRALATDLAQAFAVLESEIRQSVAAAARGRTFVHAGVVGWRGRAILVPGRSRSGKTTLVAELVEGGGLVPLGRVRRPRPARARPPLREVALDPRGGCARHDAVRRRHAEELGGSCGDAAAAGRAGRAREHRPGAAWRPATLTRGTGGARDAGAHGARRACGPEASLAALERAVARRHGAARESEARRASVAARLLRQRRGSGAGLPRRGGSEGDAMKPAARRTGLVVRDLPDELLVYDLDRHQAHCLNRTAASVFRDADGTRSLDDLGRAPRRRARSRGARGRGAHGPRPARAGAAARGRRRSSPPAGLSRRERPAARGPRRGAPAARPSRRSWRRRRPRRRPPAPATARASRTARRAPASAPTPARRPPAFRDGTCSDGSAASHVRAAPVERRRPRRERSGAGPRRPRPCGTRRAAGSPRAAGARRSGRAARPARGRPA